MRILGSLDFYKKLEDTLIMKRIKSLIPVLIIAIAAFYGTSCMTAKGSLFSDVVSTNKENTDETEKKTGLTIRTSPAWCEVYIGDGFAGISPVTEQLSSGNYRITVQKEGYHTTTEWVNYTESDSIVLDINLEPITGFLQINTKHTDIIISTGGKNLSDGVNELQKGRHLIEAELFGYVPWQKYVEITENTTTALSINLISESFRFSSLFVSRKTFNPANPAGLGETKISFEVTTYGTGELKIFKATGENILTHSFSSFAENDQVFSWTGKDDYGKKLQDGNYRIVITGRDLDENNPDLKETEITIDSSLIIRIRSTFSGIGGTLFCPTPDILPTGSFQLDLKGLGHINSKTENDRFPVILGVRGVPVRDLEISVQAGVIIQKSEAYIFSASVKKAVLPARNFKPFELAGTLKGTFLYNMYSDSQTNFTGLSGGITASVSAGPFSLVLSPELTVSPFRVSYPSEKNSGFYIWGYGRSALLIDLGPTMIAVSGAMRTVPFTEDFAIDYPYSTGVELHWLIPGTGIFISGIVSGEFNSSDYYINAGGGVGIIN